MQRGEHQPRPDCSKRASLAEVSQSRTKKNTVLRRGLRKSALTTLAGNFRPREKGATWISIPLRQHSVRQMLPARPGGSDCPSAVFRNHAFR
jgi:hypothetical protein